MKDKLKKIENYLFNKREKGKDENNNFFQLNESFILKNEE